MTAARFQVTFDAAEPARLARFWATALGFVRQPLGVALVDGSDGRHVFIG
jgi:hypothetical protein